VQVVSQSADQHAPVGLGRGLKAASAQFVENKSVDRSANPRRIELRHFVFGEGFERPPIGVDLVLVGEGQPLGPNGPSFDPAADGWTSSGLSGGASLGISGLAPEMYSTSKLASGCPGRSPPRFRPGQGADRIAKVEPTLGFFALMATDALSFENRGDLRAKIGCFVRADNPTGSQKRYQTDAEGNPGQAIKQFECHDLLWGLGWGRVQALAGIAATPPSLARADRQRQQTARAKRSGRFRLVARQVSAMRPRYGQECLPTDCCFTTGGVVVGGEVAVGGGVKPCVYRFAKLLSPKSAYVLPAPRPTRVVESVVVVVPIDRLPVPAPRPTPRSVNVEPWMFTVSVSATPVKMPAPAAVTSLRVIVSSAGGPEFPP